MVDSGFLPSGISKQILCNYTIDTLKSTEYTIIIMTITRVKIAESGREC